MVPLHRAFKGVAHKLVSLLMGQLLFYLQAFLTADSIISVVALCGGLCIMVGSQERGLSLIIRAGIGYIVVQMIPLFMRLLVEVAKAI